MTLKYALRSITDKKQGICERRVNRNLHHTTHVSNFLRTYYFLYEIKKTNNITLLELFQTSFNVEGLVKS
jgi:hypothetical protein